jgi:hypothetical protein
MLGVIDQRDQEWQVGIGLHVLGEEWHLPVDEAFLQDHLAHRHGKGGIGARLGPATIRRRTWCCPPNRG